MPDGQIPAHPRPALLWIAIGRQRVGKTTVLNAAVQYFRSTGAEVEVWNADQQNRSHSLSTFFPDALVPPAPGLGEVRSWIEERLADQACRRFHAVLDAGGGATGFESLVEEIPILETLAGYGISPVGVFVLGPEKADLDYLDHFGDAGLFRPERTAIILNAGLVLSERSAAGAFGRVQEAAAFQRAVGDGARVIVMPPLSCMAEVTDRGVTFAQAADRITKPGQAPFSMFDPVRVKQWWEKRIPEFFGQFPPEWLPSKREPEASASEGGVVRFDHPSTEGDVA